MSDIDRETQASPPVRITNAQEDRIADVINLLGLNRLAVDANISSVNVPLGKDPLPDTYFYITEAGDAGSTITIDIAATNVDPTNPDRDLPAYSYTYTLTAQDEGDERQLSINLADALNADPLFEAQYLEAFAIGDDGDDNQRAIVHITSTKFSLNGEFYERPNAGDFEVTTSVGTGVAFTELLFFSDDFRKIVSRSKEVSLARDPRNPHRLGVQSISGSVFIRSQDPEKLIREYLLSVTTPANGDQMAVNGQVTPQVYEKVSNPDGESDVIIDALKFICSDGNMKVQSGTFLGNNQALTSPILVELIRDGIAIFSTEIFNTPDLLGGFSSTASDNKIINQAGGDYLESTFSLIDSNLAFVLRNGKNDAVRVTIQDNLTAIDSIKVQLTGSED